MAQFTRMETLNAIYKDGLVPVFYHAEIEVAKKVVDAVAAGGSRVLEFTNRGDFAYEVFAQIVKYCREAHPRMIVGVGSVCDAPTAGTYLANGANFVVGPVLNPEVARVCNRRKVPYSPGCGTATEIQQAEELGSEIVKIFPGGEVGGPAFVQALKGPCPWSAIMPTGGVDTTEDSVTAWIEAGCAALGIGSKLITKDAVAAGDFTSITDKVARCLWWIKKARGESVFVGIEHPGIFPTEPGGGEAIAEWYGKAFGFDVVVGNTSVFVVGQGKGRLEVMKDPAPEKAHVCILVHDMDEAMAQLQVKGFKLESINEKPGLKAVFLKDSDPGGYRVHLLWNPSIT